MTWHVPWVDLIFSPTHWNLGWKSQLPVRNLWQSLGCLRPHPIHPRLTVLDQWKYVNSFVPIVLIFPWYPLVIPDVFFPDIPIICPLSSHYIVLYWDSNLFYLPSVLFFFGRRISFATPILTFAGFLCWFFQFWATKPMTHQNTRTNIPTSPIHVGNPIVKFYTFPSLEVISPCLFKYPLVI